MIPIAKRIKSFKTTNNNHTNASTTPSSSANQNVKLSSLDEQIALLESSIQSSSRGPYGSDDDSIDYDDDDDNGHSISLNEPTVPTLITEKDEHGNITKFISQSNLDRIASLPKAYLPEPQLRKHRNNDDDDHKEKANLKKQKKRKKDSIDGSTSNSISSSGGTTNIDLSNPPTKNGLSGLESTIREMLRNYQPLSGDKIPFYCRICRYQGTDLNDWNQHKLMPEHEIASEIELKMSYCKLCRKQFTSPAQLKEHLNAKPHKQKLKDIKEKQSQHEKQRAKFS